MSLGGASCNILPKYFETTAPAMSEEGMEMFFNAIDVEECEVSSIEEQGTITTNSLLKRVAK